MDIIEKIEIRYFRSFDGGQGQPNVSIEHLGDFNVFSGANDSGKSNVLRALNLFFNNEISPGVPFNKERDFSKIVSNRFDAEVAEKLKNEKKRISDLKESGVIESEIKQRDLRRSDEVISIKLFFNNYNKQRGLPKKFWVSKSYSQKNNFEGEYISQKKLRGAQLSIFLKNFKFEYVPAIKDRDYFNHLFQKLQTYLFEKEDKRKENKFAQTSRKFNETLKNETKQLFENFKINSGVDANFHIPSTLVDFFRTLSVKTENDIGLFERGDGIQARFIPEILEEICSNSRNNIIWGFEEPENSYETKNIRKIRDDFLNKYSKTKQIFVTSHTKEFLSVKRVFTKEEEVINNDNKLNTNAKEKAAVDALPASKKSSSVSIYRVWKDSKNMDSSRITRFDEDNGAWEDTCDDLGLVQEARIIDDLQIKISQQSKEIKESQLTAEQKESAYKEIVQDSKKCVAELKDAKKTIKEYEKPNLIVEDELDAIYKIAYLKIIGENISLSDYSQKFDDNAPFIIIRAGGAGKVSSKLRMNNTDGLAGKKLIGLFDFDKEGSENFYHLKKEKIWSDDILGIDKTGLYRKCKDHDFFFALLLPVPKRHLGIIADIKSGNFNSYVEIENLLPDAFLIQHALVKEEQITGAIKYKKIRSDKKEKMETCLINAPISTFDDFVPLFSQIGELFGIKIYNN